MMVLSLDTNNYNGFVEESPQGSIFCKSWWLDAVSHGSYKIITIEDGNRIKAAWPIVFTKKYGFTFVGMPTLTQTLGIQFSPDTNSTEKQKRYTLELLNKLPKHTTFIQNFNYNYNNWMPLYWNGGFRQTTRYTYVIDDLSDLNSVWNLFSVSLKKHIRKAERSEIKIHETDDIELFYEINKLTFKRQKLDIPYSIKYIKNLDDACSRNNARKIFIAKDQKGHIHCAVYLVYDKNSCYLLMNGNNPEFRSSSANNLLIWESIKFSAQVSKVFDFEGSMIESVEQFFRSFGAKLKPYSCIYKYSLLLELLNNKKPWF